ncbi:glycoside hydrolase family 5 protein [Thalassobacterium sedimentorum]|nr:cellulase family glycosylhydrolase [Coraliomargarita sp. SDUM461004]
MKSRFNNLFFVVLLLFSTHSCIVANPTFLSWGERVGATPHRGVNTGSWLSSWDMSVVKSWGSDVTLIRLQLMGDHFIPILDPYGQWTFPNEGWLALDAFLNNARSHGLKVVIDMHQTRDYFPRRHSAEDWGSQQNRDKLCSIWTTIAKRYRYSRGVIAGFDILNEPCPPDNLSGYDMWNQTALEVTNAIRRFDDYHTIIVESAGYGSARCFDYLVPTGDNNTVYSFHLYDPHEFSEQGTRVEWPFGDDGVSGYVYPGIIPLGWFTKVDTLVDSAYISNKLEPVRQFQDDYNARIYVGEFGCIRWTPTAAGEVYNSTSIWFEDVLNLIEAEGWDWTHHAYRLSANGAYSIEHSSDPTDNSRYPNSDNLQLFKLYWD